VDETLRPGSDRPRVSPIPQWEEEPGPLVMSKKSRHKCLGAHVVQLKTGQEVLMSTVKHLLEVARFRRHKAYCLARDAPSMPLAEDRARLIQYAKFFEEEAAKLEERADGLRVGAPNRKELSRQRSLYRGRSKALFAT
jgi:hypothetical protein